MPDYNTKIYREQGGERIVVAAGGSIDVHTGGVFTVNGEQLDAIADVPTAGSATAAGNATAINLILARLRSLGAISES